MDLWYAHYDEDRLQQLIQGAVAEAGKVEENAETTVSFEGFNGAHITETITDPLPMSRR